MYQRTGTPLLTQNPMVSGNGAPFLNGLADMLDWQNVRSDGSAGIIYAAAFVATGSDDCLAWAKGDWGTAHRARGKVFLDGAYTPPDSHEIELFLMARGEPHWASGLEIDIGWNSNIPLDIVKWNGPAASFTSGLLLSRPNPTVPTHGMVIEASIDKFGNIVITADGVVCALGVDNTATARFTQGAPGMGFFVRTGTGADPTKFCWQSWEGFAADGSQGGILTSVTPEFHEGY